MRYCETILRKSTALNAAIECCPGRHIPQRQLRDRVPEGRPGEPREAQGPLQREAHRRRQLLLADESPAGTHSLFSAKGEAKMGPPKP